MNLADSVKYVLKNKSQNVFKEFWKDDLANFFSESKSDISHFFKSSFEQFKKLKRGGVKISAKEMLESASDALTIFKVIPRRVKEGFAYFREDFIEELEKKTDQKQKTIFCLKVMGTLSSFIVGAVYNLKIGKSDLGFVGIRTKNAFTQFLVAELIFKISQVLIIKFLTEVEKQMEDPDELNNVRYFKTLLSDRDKIESERENLGEEASPGDPSIVIVDELKNYIMTGKRTLHNS